MEKLVRDNIISKILSNGEVPHFRQVSGQEKLEFLFKKLLEEAWELQEAQNREEMADVEEVILAIYAHIWWTKQQVEEVRKKKLKTNGWFQNGDILQLGQ